jgi:hypothetical protein
MSDTNEGAAAAAAAAMIFVLERDERRNQSTENSGEKQKTNHTRSPKFRGL